MERLKVPEAPAIDTHGHYGRYTDGNSIFGDERMSVLAADVAERAMNEAGVILWDNAYQRLGLEKRAIHH